MRFRSLSKKKKRCIYYVRQLHDRNNSLPHEIVNFFNNFFLKILTRKLCMKILRIINGILINIL